MRLPTVALALAAAAFVAGSLAFVALDAVQGRVFGALFRMHLYHESHPLGFIGVAAVAFGAVGAGWVRWFGDARGWRRWASAVGAVALAVVVASGPGGVLWAALDMAAGYVPEGPAFWRHLRWGAGAGLRVGWLVALLSVPYNIVGVAFGVWALDRAGRAAGTG